ncbi:MAG: chorismate mutase [Robiginitomaculum sp.]|nr:chorismate mutase [Robiginitomaculum sp.]
MTNYLSDPRKNTAENCNAMSEVRYEIDRLDRLLVTLIKERQDYMDAAARIKDNRSVVRDEARVEDVVRKVLLASNKAGLSAKIAEPVWRTMIEQCIAYEFESWDELRKD